MCVCVDCKCKSKSKSKSKEGQGVSEAGMRKRRDVQEVAGRDRGGALTP